MSDGSDPGSMLPRGLGRWSHTATVGSGKRLVFIAGQTSHDADGAIVGEDDFPTQFRQVYRNLRLALDTIPADWSDIVSLRTILTRQADVVTFRSMRDADHDRLFPDGRYPPNTLIVVSALADPELLLEIEAVVSV